MSGRRWWLSSMMAAKKHRREAEEAGNGHIHRTGPKVGHHRQRQDTADHEQDEKDRERSRGTGDPEAEKRPEADEPRHEDLVGRGLGDDEPGQKDADRHQAGADERNRGKLRAKDNRPRCGDRGQ